MDFSRYFEKPVIAHISLKYMYLKNINTKMYNPYCKVKKTSKNIFGDENITQW